MGKIYVTSLVIVIVSTPGGTVYTCNKMMYDILACILYFGAGIPVPYIHTYIHVYLEGEVEVVCTVLIEGDHSNF